jgi:hypothetical protein
MNPRGLHAPISKRGRAERMVEMNEEAFSLLVGGFTGAAASETVRTSAREPTRMCAPISQMPAGETATGASYTGFYDRSYKVTCWCSGAASLLHPGGGEAGSDMSRPLPLRSRDTATWSP